MLHISDHRRSAETAAHNSQHEAAPPRPTAGPRQLRSSWGTRPSPRSTAACGRSQRGSNTRRLRPLVGARRRRPPRKPEDGPPSPGEHPPTPPSTLRGPRVLLTRGLSHRGTLVQAPGLSRPTRCKVGPTPAAHSKTRQRKEVTPGGVKSAQQQRNPRGTWLLRASAPFYRNGTGAVHSGLRSLKTAFVSGFELRNCRGTWFFGWFYGNFACSVKENQLFWGGAYLWPCARVARPARGSRDFARGPREVRQGTGFLIQRIIPGPFPEGHTGIGTTSALRGMLAMVSCIGSFGVTTIRKCSKTMCTVLQDRKTLGLM